MNERESGEIREWGNGRMGEWEPDLFFISHSPTLPLSHSSILPDRRTL